MNPNTEQQHQGFYDFFSDEIVEGAYNLDKWQIALIFTSVFFTVVLPLISSDELLTQFAAQTGPLGSYFAFLIYSMARVISDARSADKYSRKSIALANVRSIKLYGLLYNAFAVFTLVQSPTMLNAGVYGILTAISALQAYNSYQLYKSIRNEQAAYEELDDVSSLEELLEDEWQDIYIDETGEENLNR